MEIKTLWTLFYLKLKIILANQCTTILHGKKSAEDSASTAKDTFENRSIGKNLPEVKIKKSEIDKGLNILNLLASNNIISSKSEARRIIENKGLKINDIILEDVRREVRHSDLEESSYIKISVGKKRHYLIKFI